MKPQTKTAHIADFTGLIPPGTCRFGVVPGEYGSNAKAMEYFWTVRHALQWMRRNGYELPKSQPATFFGFMS